MQFKNLNCHNIMHKEIKNIQSTKHTFNHFKEKKFEINCLHFSFHIFLTI